LLPIDGDLEAAMRDRLAGPTTLAAAFATALALAGAPAQAAPVDTAGATQCQVSGWAMDPDPNGTNVRSGPRGNAPVIGHLAPSRKVGQGEYTAPQFDIIGSKDGWLLIRNPRPPTDLKWEPGNAADGRGWVFAKLVGLRLASGPLRAAPRHDAAVLAQLKDTAGVQAFYGCQGDYVDVTVIPLGGRPLRGWTARPCRERFTACANSD
jgi:hypothetical protein